ncbi:hypothetical protein [Sandaracinus amylolyticus]|uniref:Uncharacterized protein n=1 Tax=Sandaracinus amylolyticus TaxID=927083 RepID=A0A0F6W6W3_9BACT|nr:hypothetical protein [Sandaracinus amylolyticus]AKF08796.1 hypothetical protein DB32_005945 [Sandaracinus amylolyticus]
MSMRAFAGVLAVVLAAAAGTAGWSFVWCAPMSQAQLHCCCPDAPRGHDSISRDCCDERSMPGVPRVDAHDDATPRTIAAPLIGVLPLWAWLGAERIEESSLRGLDVEARAGPSIRRHVSISVFLL